MTTDLTTKNTKKTESARTHEALPIGRRWTPKTAQWFAEAARESDFPPKALRVMRPVLKRCGTVLDIGAGTGVFAVPIAAMGLRVTAVEPSAPMMSQLEAEARRRGVRSRIRCIRRTWEETRAWPHDAVLCINIPGSLVDNPDFIRQVDALARRAVFVVQSVSSGFEQKFFYDALYPLIFRKPFVRKGGDYLDTYRVIHGAGIYPNTRIIQHHFDQKFADMDKAVQFWEEHLRVPPGKHRDILEPFLRERLTALRGGGLVRAIRRSSAVMWWEKKSGLA